MPGPSSAACAVIRDGNSDVDMMPESIYASGMAAVSGRHTSVHNRMWTAISVRHYIASFAPESDRNYMDARRFSHMRFDDMNPCVSDSLRIYRLTRVADWVARWVHCGGCGILGSNAVDRQLEMSYVRCTE